MSVTALPVDVVLEIAGLLDLPDCLNLASTCFWLRSFLGMKSFWLQVLHGMQVFHGRLLPCPPGTTARVAISFNPCRISLCMHTESIKCGRVPKLCLYRSTHLIRRIAATKFASSPVLVTSSPSPGWSLLAGIVLPGKSLHTFPLPNLFRKSSNIGHISVRNCAIPTSSLIRRNTQFLSVPGITPQRKGLGMAVLKLQYTTDPSLRPAASFELLFSRSLSTDTNHEVCSEPCVGLSSSTISIAVTTIPASASDLPLTMLWYARFRGSKQVHSVSFDVGLGSPMQCAIHDEHIYLCNFDGTEIFRIHADCATSPQENFNLDLCGPGARLTGRPQAAYVFPSTSSMLCFSTYLLPDYTHGHLCFWPALPQDSSAISGGLVGEPIFSDFLVHPGVLGMVTVGQSGRAADAPGDVLPYPSV
ncbi:hypothetical protein C8F01DRAFT_1229627 [Mycena amicta]|nr:hypothetical protein C8F01DRAFT_1229627 [Mycena amicta]